MARLAFSVALVGRNEERLAEGVKALKAKGIDAAAFRADAGDPAAVRAAIGKARATLGPIAVLQWTGLRRRRGGRPRDRRRRRGRRCLRRRRRRAHTAAVQEALPDLKASKEGAVLVTNGAFGDNSLQMDELAANFKAMGLALANAAKHKLVGLLAQRLKGDGIYVGEVMVAGTVKGTAWDRGNANLDPGVIAAKFWELYEARGEIRARVG